jgi:LPS-assembly lipoprotein
MWWSKRTLLAAGIAAILLAGCGFHLRGQASYQFRSIHVNAPGASSFAADLKRALEASGSAAIADDPATAEVILDIPLVSDSKDVLSLSVAGRVQEFALEKHVQFLLHDQANVHWLKPDEIVIRRTYSYNDSERLARGIQESRLLRSMQADAIQQIVRRLQAARRP